MGLVENILRMGAKGERKMMEGVHLTKIYHKHFVNATMYSQYNINMIVKIKIK
jgi:hypothetical protein